MVNFKLNVAHQFRIHNQDTNLILLNFCTYEIRIIVMVQLLHNISFYVYMFKCSGWCSTFTHIFNKHLYIAKYFFGSIGCEAKHAPWKCTASGHTDFWCTKPHTRCSLQQNGLAVQPLWPSLNYVNSHKCQSWLFYLGRYKETMCQRYHKNASLKLIIP